MMSFRNKIFTAHEKADLPEPSARVVLVREGFSWLAFVFGALWLIVRGLWVATAGYLLLNAVIVFAAQRLGVSLVAFYAIEFFLQLALGFTANDLVRESLTRRGYVFKGVVVAETTLNAERRYFDAVA